MQILPSLSSSTLMPVSLVWGAVLNQTHEDGTDAVIAYASRNLSKAESHYPAHKLKFLSLKLMVVKKFLEYLYGSTFEVYRDNSQCWVASLANYNFQLYY